MEISEPNMGVFGVRAGGIHWHSMSPFTMGIFQAFDLYSIFDRTPWEAVNNTEKYENYFDNGTVSDDIRWNNRAFQGLIVDGGALPGRVSFSFLFGKSQVNGGVLAGIPNPQSTIINPGTAGNVPTYIGFAGPNRVLPNSLSGLRLKKRFWRHFISYNTLYNRRRLDSLKEVFQTYAVHTAEFGFFSWQDADPGEVGFGNYQLPDQDKQFGEVAMLRVNTPRDYTFLPLELQLYQISKNFYNDNGEIQTFSNPAIQNASSGPNQVGQASVGGALTQVGQLVHNRRGINLSTAANAGPFSFQAGMGHCTGARYHHQRAILHSQDQWIGAFQVYNPSLQVPLVPQS